MTFKLAAAILAFVISGGQVVFDTFQNHQSINPQHRVIKVVVLIFSVISLTYLGRDIYADVKPVLITGNIAETSDKCDVISGNITSSTGIAVGNAKVTVLNPDVSAYEYESIHDRSSVLSSAESDAEGNYQATLQMSRGFKYSMLVQAEGYEDGKFTLDQTEQCQAKNNINFILEKHLG